MPLQRFLWTLVGLCMPALAIAADADLELLIAQVKGVGKQGAGNMAAAKAWRELVRRDAAALPTILASINSDEPLSANWLRAAVDAIAERELKAKRLPLKELEAFIRDLDRDPRARRLAYEWLMRADATAPDRLLPGMLQDPSTELRRDAVTVVLKQAQTLQEKDAKPAATAAYQKALAGARDRDQVDLIAKQLKSLGVEVDLAQHFGYVQSWVLLGPFDSTGGAGFARAYPPEEKVDLTATCTGKKDAELRWKPYTTSDPYGLVDLNKAIGKNMGAAAYAFAALESPVDRLVEIRAQSNNAIKIFLNGKEILAREEYHHGHYMDQYAATGMLRAGRNELLIKVCQNEQTEEWAQEWSFHARVCDKAGTAVPIKVLTAGKASAPGKGKGER